ncbi:MULTISPECIES: LTA synthase family protein [unclassified Enterococcus]|uniref:LTA synthase family protein n=1 Tax=unclassified Enterococcus TaxID=2608891 RepID=UPI0024749808|nr:MULTISPECIES: LTA synthase family protein [unclassified Enterococcus]
MKEKNRSFPWQLLIKILAILAVVLISNLYLQWSQNDHSLDLAIKFAFSWHVAKFFLGCSVLLVLLLLLITFSGSFTVGMLFYSCSIGILGYADYLKMAYREEPIYPDDLKMITEFGMLKDLVGTRPFVFLLIIILIAAALLLYAFVRSLRLSKKWQVVRVFSFAICASLLFYVGSFNDENNLLRKAYNQTALWIPYSQKMNYYNVGFIGGFLYNLNVEAMNEPAGYSQTAIEEIVAKYQQQATTVNQQQKAAEQPHIIYIMSESFSDPSALNGITVKGEPLVDYFQLAKQTYSGKMLSQNYGGGTANIEFEALTSFSMELMNGQMTTPYTMLVSDLPELPSVVSFLGNQGYQTTAIHPYNTSMYKRQDVYQKLGFQQFLDEDSMQHTDKIANNEYISDQAAYQEILDLLKQSADPQFVHLVTMQTHMPYGDKYEQLDYLVSGNDNNNSLANYLQDIAYSAEALKNFMTELQQIDERVLVVFWGDHLPGIYSKEIQAANQGHKLHETEFLMWDTKGILTQTKEQQAITSPCYFSADLFQQTAVNSSGFYQLLLALQQELPAFEQGLYYQEAKWQENLNLTQEQLAIYQEYQLIQYDILSGKQYSLAAHFFDAPNDK